MNEWKIKKSPLPLPLQGSLQQSHLVYCSAKLSQLPADCTAGWKFSFCFCFFLHEGSYVETPGYGSSCQGAVCLIPASCRPYTTGMQLPNLQTPARSACFSVCCCLWRTTGLLRWPQIRTLAPTATNKSKQQAARSPYKSVRAKTFLIFVINFAWTSRLCMSSQNFEYV